MCGSLHPAAQGSNICGLFDASRLIDDFTSVFDFIWEGIRFIRYLPWLFGNKSYSINGNGEAEEIVIHEMINWFKKEFSKQLEESDIAALEDEIKSTYEVLN